MIPLCFLDSGPGGWAQTFKSKPPPHHNSLQSAAPTGPQASCSVLSLCVFCRFWFLTSGLNKRLRERKESRASNSGERPLIPLTLVSRNALRANTNVCVCGSVWPPVWSTEYRYKNDQSEKLIRGHLEINHIYTVGVGSTQHHGNLNSIYSRLQHYYEQVSTNLLILVSNHSPLWVKGIKHAKMEMKQSLVLISSERHERKRVGEGEKSREGRRRWRKPWLQGWRTDKGYRTGGREITCCWCCAVFRARFANWPSRGRAQTCVCWKILGWAAALTLILQGWEEKAAK